MTTTSAATPITLGRAGQAAWGTFTGIAGQPLTLAVAQNTFTSAIDVDVTAPDGSKLTSSYVSAADTQSINVTPKVGGKYTFRLVPYSASTGSLSLTLSGRVAAGTLTTTGSAIKATASRPGQELAFTFAATAGQPLSVGITGNTFSSALYVSLLDPSGTATSYSQYVSAGDSPALRLPAITTAGTYTLVLGQGSDVLTGSVTATLSTDLTPSTALARRRRRSQSPGLGSSPGLP